MNDMQFSVGGCDFSASQSSAAELHCVQSVTSSYGIGSSGPVTVLVIDEEEPVRLEWLEQEKQRMLQTDDVFNKGFLKHVILYRITTNPYYSEKHQLGSEGDNILKSWNSVFTMASSNTPLRSGPYYLDGKYLHKVCRLYEDPNEAFMFGVTEKTTKPPTFQEHRDGRIPVPSRLYFEPAVDKYPLRGKRVAVKDVFHLEGTPTSASSRDFQKHFGPAGLTAKMVLRLIEAGAVIVGKTKTVQFASGEHARDWVDYQCPFNPRGDGYMEPDGSSTGSAVAVAAYDWLDYSIGTDTLGSMLGPAASQGIFGLRPTHGISDLEGIVPVSQYLDTAGFFARSIVDFDTFGMAWYASSQVETDDPSRVLYPAEEFDKFPDDARRLMDSFVKDVERVFNISKSDFDVSTIWNEAEPTEQRELLPEYLAKTLAHIQLFDCYRANLPFRKEFKSLHGREPYANPMIRFKWDLGSNLTNDDYETALKQQRVYRKFLREHVIDDNTIIVLPCGNPIPRYRDLYDGPPTESGWSLQGFGFRRDLYSFLGGLPQLVIPVGSVIRESPVTHGKVEEPVCISLVGAQGTDCKLMALVEQILRKSGRPLEVKTGSTLF